MMRPGVRASRNTLPVGGERCRYVYRHFEGFTPVRVILDGNMRDIANFRRVQQAYFPDNT